MWGVIGWCQCNKTDYFRLLQENENMYLWNWVQGVWFQKTLISVCLRHWERVKTPESQRMLLKVPDSSEL